MPYLPFLFFAGQKNGTLHYGGRVAFTAFRLCVAALLVKSRSGYHFPSQLTVPGKTALSTLKIHDFLSKMPCLPFIFFAGQKTALFTMGAGCLHCVQALRRRRSRSSPGSQPPSPVSPGLSTEKTAVVTNLF